MPGVIRTGLPAPAAAQLASLATTLSLAAPAVTAAPAPDCAAREDLQDSTSRRPAVLPWAEAA